MSLSGKRNWLGLVAEKLLTQNRTLGRLSMENLPVERHASEAERDSENKSGSVPVFMLPPALPMITARIFRN